LRIESFPLRVSGSALKFQVSGGSPARVVLDIQKAELDVAVSGMRADAVEMMGVMRVMVMVMVMVRGGCFSC
jgi:hypothetical protein